MAHSFANVLYLSVCMLGNCSCFYFRLLTFFKIKFLKINHPGPPSSVKQFGSRSRPTFCWSSSGFKLFAKGYWQATKLSTGMQRVITGKYFSVQYIVSYRDKHVQSNFGRSNSPVSNTRDCSNSFVGPGNFPIH